GAGRAGRRRVPCGPVCAPVAAVRRVARVRRDVGAARRGAGRGLPRRAGRAAARVRRRPRARRGGRHGEGPRRATDRLPALAALLPAHRGGVGRLGGTPFVVGARWAFAGTIPPSLPPQVSPRYVLRTCSFVFSASARSASTIRPVSS